VTDILELAGGMLVLLVLCAVAGVVLLIARHGTGR
jgi:hypothetical protein